MSYLGLFCTIFIALILIGALLLPKLLFTWTGLGIAALIALILSPLLYGLI